jgi:signal peptidase II
LSPRLAALLKALLVCGVVVALDQLSKGLVREHIGRSETVEVLPFLDLENTRNDGVAFGLAGDVPPALIGVAIALLVAVLAFITMRGEPRPLVWLPAGLLVGGALGNLIDRIRDGAVTDWVELPRWPTFNLADVSITVGVVLLVLLPELTRRRRGDGEGGSREGGDEDGESETEGPRTASS